MPAAPSTLRLPPREATADYAAILEWELFARGEYQLSTIGKAVSLHVQPQEQGGYAVDFRLGTPTLARPEDQEPLQELALRLAALYAWVAVHASTTGEVTALRNHEAIQLAWAQLSQQVQATMAEGDQVTSSILAHLGQQVQSPASFLQSLSYDYLYQALLPNLYHQPLAGPAAQMRSRQFASFFDNTTLWFSERTTLLPEAPAGQVRLRLEGALDTQKTDVAAVRGHIAQALGLAPEALPAPHFHYEATYTFALATGLPTSVELSVYARAGQLYNKEYTLTISRL